jgi:hypothetical protein
MLDLWELPHSGIVSDSGQRLEILYGLKGTTDKFQALSHIANNTDQEIAGIPRAAINAEIPEGFVDVWEVSVVYQTGGGSSSGPNPTEIGEERVSFSTRPNRVRLYQAKEHIADYANVDEGESIPNYEGAINVTPERIEGVEVDVAGFVYQVRKIMADDQITQLFIRNSFLSTSRVNAATWRGFRAGELRLVAVDAQQRDSESWEVTWEFLAEENLQDITIGDIEGVAKLGHEYAWVRHREIVDDTTDPPRVRTEVESVHIERVYDTIDFNVSLGLGG